jgi:uncharacterized RDD family membrane protein YckC
MAVCNSCGQDNPGVAQFCQYCGSTIPQGGTVSTPSAQPHAVVYAGFWLRAGAFVLDWALLGVVMSALVLVSGAGVAIGIAVPWLYEALMLSSDAQATVGKKALGIVVTDTLGGRLTFGRASGRHFAKYLSSLFFGLGFIMVAFTEKRQGLHDLLAGSVAIRRG